MNKRYAGLLVVLLVLATVTGAIALDYRLKFGQGWTVSATTTVTRKTFSQAGEPTNQTWYAYNVSVKNTGTNVVYMAKNCTTNEFATMIAATNTIPVPASTTFNFEIIDSRDRIYSVCVQAAAATSTVYIAAY